MTYQLQIILLGPELFFGVKDDFQKSSAKIRIQIHI